MEAALTHSSKLYVIAFAVILLLVPPIEWLAFRGLKRLLAPGRAGGWTGPPAPRSPALRTGLFAYWALSIGAHGVFFAYALLWLMRRDLYVHPFTEITGVYGLWMSAKGTFAFFAGAGELRHRWQRRHQPDAPDTPAPDPETRNVASLADASAEEGAPANQQPPPSSPASPGSAERHARNPPPHARPQLLSRGDFLTKLGLAMAAVPAAGLSYAMLRGRYAFQVHEKTLHFSTLPAAFDGLRILQLSDIHAGSFTSTDEFAAGIRLAQAQQADLIVLTGDLVNNLATELPPFADILHELSAPMGKFAVLGNHDYGDYLHWTDPAAYQANRRAIQAAYRELGYHLLMNEHLPLNRGGERMWLVGTENWGRHITHNYGDLDAAVRGLPDDGRFRLLLSHDPTFWDDQARPHPKEFELMLSGHTHGMQFGMDLEGLRWSPIQYSYPRWADLYREGGAYLYVNRGFGFARFPGRLGVLPEIAVFTLRRGTAA